ncbi:MAG: matrixin family metalloprotease [Actinomycetota bacterium]
MRLRTLFVVAALSALMVAAVPAWAKPTAKLIKVDVFKQGAKPTARANCSNDGATNGLYKLTGWKVVGDKTAHLNTSTVPSGIASGVQAALQASFDAWNASGVPHITVATNGTVTRYTANHSYDLLWGRTGGSSIAVTYTWQWSNGEMESDTVFNSGLSWANINATADGCNEAVAAYDVANIATHEFGHTYGIDHPGDDRYETMYAYGYTGETLKRSIGSGDQTAITTLY